MLPNRRRLAIGALAAFVLIAAVHLASHALARPSDDTFTLTNITQWLLMPPLAVGLAAARPAPRIPLERLAIIALGFSWLGDTLPDVVGTDAAFLTMVGCFLVAQLAWIIAFLPWRGRSFLRTSRPAVIGYAVCLAGLVVLCAPNAGSLLVPVLIYGVCLTLMALLASGLGRVAAIGGLLFFVSDAMIAIGAFARDSFLPHGDAAVMSTYIAAQALLVVAVLHETGRHRRRPPQVPAGAR